LGVEVQLQAVSGEGTELDADNDALIVVTMEHSATCKYSNYKLSAGTHFADDSCHPQAVTIGTGVVHAIH
jgi:hypothetical protein